ncbi:MAG: protein TolR [Gammaproteobacteria bacterium]|nr:MAG: protein TolR [Gammaproteobacteria bacterium]
MARTRQRRRPMSEINVVPYIDVMLVLLVIFMITAPLLTQGVKVDLPRASAEPLPPEALEPLVLTIDAAGRYYLNVGGAGETVPIELETLYARVAAVLKYKPGTPVMVRGDKQVDYGRVIEAMVHLQAAGAPAVGLITEPPEGPSG